MPPLPVYRSFVHGAPGPVDVPLLEDTTPAQNSAARPVTGVAPDDQVVPFVTPADDWSSSAPIVAASPDTSYTVTPPDPLPTNRLLPEITTAVWPPAQLGSAHISAAAFPPVVVVSGATSCAKLSAAPPRVIPEIDEAAAKNVEATHTTRQFPAPVAGIVGDRLFPTVLLTRAIATAAGQSSLYTISEGTSVSSPDKVTSDVDANVPTDWRLRVSPRSEEHTSELQSRRDLVCRLL